MIIDFHRHLWSIFERYPHVASPDGSTRDRAGNGAAVSLTVPDVGQRGKELIEEMDQAGVGRSVIFLGDYGLRLGEGVYSIEAENRLHAELARSYPDRLTAFLGVDPRRPGALELFRTALDEWNVRGLKLHPSAGFFPHDPVCLPFFDLAGQRGVPVAVHTGPMASPMLSHTAQPIHLDQVAADFPKTTIVMQHSGQYCWWREALNIAFWKPNVVLELSMWQWIYQRDPREFIAAIAHMKAAVGIQRILFASDFPGLRQAMPMDEWIGVFRALPALADQYGYRVTDDDVDAILGRNAQRILGLTN